MREHRLATDPKDDQTIIEATNIMRRIEHALSVTRPMYQLGDLVCVISECEDGTTTDFGYVTGIEIDPPHADPGWWYAVCLVGNQWHNLTEWVSQDDIAGRVIHGSYGHGS